MNLVRLLPGFELAVVRIAATPGLMSAIAPRWSRVGLVRVLTSALMATLTACSAVGPDVGSGIFSDTEDFRPTPAPVVSSVTCDAPDIVDSLGYNRSTSINPQYPANGSIPDDFTPIRVVRCEVTEDADTANIDEVTLTGEMGPVVDAFNTPSTRYKNGEPSCAVRAFSPVALWLVSDRGAIRTAWPSTDCDLKPDPLDPLAGLRESGRRTVATVQRFPGTTLSSPCTGFIGVVRDRDKDRRPAVRLPEQTVASTTLCGVQIRRLTNSDTQKIQTGSSELSPTDSTRLVQAVLAAPRASRCTSEATDFVSATLRRPDGSGGATMTIERDGCRRISIDNLIPLRTTTPAIATLLQRTG